MGNLVLTRRPGEAIQIGPDITVHIVSVEGQKVRVAIHAPKEVQVVRDNAVVTVPKEVKS
jgi:carbon storage regulator